MALFKKTCSVCGGSSGLLTSKKLADGVVCGDCIKKLSSWFEGYKESSVADINRQLEYREENRRALDDFSVTKSWGVKKYQVATQFIFDKDHRKFVVVDGPDDTFRERNPDIMDFDQVKKVWLEVDEYWTEGNGEFETRPMNQNLTQDKYKEVYWRYDFYLNIDTEHPYVSHIRYPMNFKTTIMKVPQNGIFFRRGLGIGGEYEGAELDDLAEMLTAIGDKDASAARRREQLDIILTRNKGKSTLEAVGDGLIRSIGNDVYQAKIENMGAHIARAARISRLLTGR